MGALFGSPSIPEPDPLTIDTQKTEEDLTAGSEDDVRRRAILRRARRRGVDTLTIDPIGGDQDRLTI